jgi:ABC-2 type transport system permease protein
MKTMVMLIRREFWEHRVFVWLPLILCVAFLATCVLLGANLNINSADFGGGRRGITPNVPGFFMVLTFLLPVVVTALMAVVTFFYLSDSLYADRKDRSILFWKSLPVSDTLTVLSKMLVALIVVPLIVYVIAFVTNLLAMLVFKVSMGTQLFPSTFGIAEWLGANLHLLLRIFVLALWYSPLVAAQLLISVSVPRMPLVWTVLPPLALIFGERMFFGTWNIGQFAVGRLGGPESESSLNMVFGLQGNARDGLNPLPMLTHVDLWAGVAVAAVLAYAAILVRRHRSDS